MNEKVLVIGLDGGTPKLLFPFAKKGVLKNLQKIITNGSYGTLTSTIPPVTCPAWVSSVTGVNPGKHGIHDFFLSVNIAQRKIEYANSRKRKTKAIWNILSDAGKKVVILNVPVTYPPEKVNGVIVSGMLTPSINSDFVYPKKAKDDLLNLKYQIDIGETMLEQITSFKKSKIGMLNKIIELLKLRLKTAQLLMEKYDWDLFMVVFVVLDRLQHLYWKNIDPEHIAYNSQESKIIFPHILSIFEELDNAIGKLTEQAGKNTNTIIYSDHGFRPLNTHYFLNNVLQKKSYLKLKDKNNVISSSINQDFITKIISNSPLDYLIRKIPVEIRRKMGLFLIPSKDFTNIFSVSPQKTKAFYFGNGFIKITKKNVSPEEYEKTRSNIRSLFNHKMETYNKEEIYHGQFMKEIPDIIAISTSDLGLSPLIPLNDYKVLNYNSNVEIPSLMWNGQHDINGIIICNGPKILKKAEIHGNIMDIAPTILKMFEKTIPPYMDGKILKCFSSS